MTGFCDVGEAVWAETEAEEGCCINLHRSQQQQQNISLPDFQNRKTKLTPNWENSRAQGRNFYQIGLKKTRLDFPESCASSCSTVVQYLTWEGEAISPPPFPPLFPPSPTQSQILPRRRWWWWVPICVQSVSKERESPP